jgi:hypothetical protein
MPLPAARFSQHEKINARPMFHVKHPERPPGRRRPIPASPDTSRPFAGARLPPTMREKKTADENCFT